MSLSSERDSAGLTIVESVAPEWRAFPNRRWTVDSLPFLQIGAVEDSVFARVYPLGDAARLGDGRIAVAGKRHTILWYSAEGEYLFSRGGPGEGPGEFKAIDEIIPVGIDSLAAKNSTNRRITLFDGTGSFSLISLSQVNCGMAGLLRTWDGRWLGRCSARVPADGASSRPRAVIGSGEEGSAEGTLSGGPMVALISLSPDGESADTLGVFPGALERSLATSSEFALAGDRIAAGDAREHVLSILRMDGVAERIVRWSGEDLAIGGGDVEAWRESMMAVNRTLATETDPGLVRRVRESYSRVTFDRRGAYQAILVDPEQALWLHLVTYRDRPAVYRVIGPDGRWLGEVTMPANLEVTQIGRDFVLGIWRDLQTDLEFVRMYRLRKP